MEEPSTSNTKEVALKNEDLHLENLHLNTNSYVSKESVNYKNYFPEALPE